MNAALTDTRAEILIIGGGIIGASAALALARAGHDVLVVERNSGIGDGSTGSSAGIIRVHASDPQSCALAADSLIAWNDWASFLEAPRTEDLASFVPCGTLILDSDSEFSSKSAHAMDAAGIAYQRLTTLEMSKRFPYFDFRRFGPPRAVSDERFWEEPTELLPGGILTPQSGYVGDPTLAAVNIMHSAQRCGARLQTSRVVRSLDTCGDRMIGVTLQDGTTIRADATLLAAGPNSEAMLSTIDATSDFRVKIRRMREELIHVPAPKSIDVAHDGVHIVDSDLNINFRPERSDAFLVGSNGELKDEQTFISDPDDFNRHVTKAAWERTTLRLARRIPEIGVPRQRMGVVGLYDAAEDWLPIYDRSRFRGLFVAMATSGTQFKTAPVVGEMLRFILETEMSGRDHTCEVFQSPFSSRTFDTAQFSRLRSPQQGQARG